MIGVVIVTFQSADVIEACLESLRISDYSGLRVVVCDNDSADETIEIIHRWADTHGVSVGKTDSDKNAPPSWIELHQTGGNIGFAGAVNKGITFLMKDPSIELFWVLNPDSEVAPTAASAFVRRAAEGGPFSLMGGRIRFTEEPKRIQSDGGFVSTWSGICHNLNYGLLAEEGTVPNVESLDFIGGASVIASREFITRAGLMEEEYFLYYEEVDWAARRGDLPLLWCADAEVFHQGGTATGSGTLARRPTAFTNYFNYRNRIRFVKKFKPWALPTTWLFSMLRILKLFLIGATDEAWAATSGLNGLPPPKMVRERIAQQDQKHAFPSKNNT